MAIGYSAKSWLGSSGMESFAEPAEDSQEMVRLWQGFMTARLTLGVVLVLLQSTLYSINHSSSSTLLAISCAYCASTLINRLYAHARPLGNRFTGAWLQWVGVDILVFLLLQSLHGSSLNYTALCALPILFTAVLGTIKLALGTAAGVTMLLMGGNLWAYLESPANAAPYLAQSALSGVGFFAIALLASQVATRLASEGQRARTNQLAARIQRQVNELVIESLPDGVLIVDDKGCVRAANPAARMLLGSDRARTASNFFLHEESGWAPLLDLTHTSVVRGQGRELDVSIRHAGHGPRRVRARTRLASPAGPEGESLCVLFLQDQREIEARLRTEKLASMGRMSTAVAHEIRNPLAAITQANALLDEDLSDPRLKRLTVMISQNARRLDRIVEDILKVSRVHPEEPGALLTSVALCVNTTQICSDWCAHIPNQQQLALDIPSEHVLVRFELDHLHRVLVNLLDNALRYASKAPSAIQVTINASESSLVALSVWSNGAPMDQGVERHLFEPFFSSESRSTGLGLYICRELCERHGASITFQRAIRTMGTELVEGNEFVISFLRKESIHLPLLDKVSAKP